MKTKWFLICTFALLGCMGISCKHSSDSTPPPLQEPLVTVKASKTEVTDTDTDRAVILTAAVDNYNSEETEIAYQWYATDSADENEDGDLIDDETGSFYTITYPDETEKTFYYHCVATVASQSGTSNVVTIRVSKKNNNTPPSIDPTTPTDPKKYKVTENASNATINGLSSEYAEGDTVSFTVTPSPGYKITSVKMESDTLSSTNGTYTFKMPKNAVTITVTTEVAKYKVTTKAEHATITISQNEYEYGKTVSFTVKADTDYEITSVKVGAENFALVENGTYTFTMPARDVEITVTAKGVGSLDAIIW